MAGEFNNHTYLNDSFNLWDKALLYTLKAPRPKKTSRGYYFARKQIHDDISQRRDMYKEPLKAPYLPKVLSTEVPSD